MSFMGHLRQIDVGDLPYLERDLSFHELVSVGFLLYGEHRVHAEFLLQKLLVMSHSRSAAAAAPRPISSDSFHSLTSSDILLRYATVVQQQNWREYIVEALAIINARMILRKLGFQWEELRQHLLPHIAELSVNVHPMLKCLYQLCERMTKAQANRLVLTINEEQEAQGSQGTQREHLRFYDFDCLEVFLLDWISRQRIVVGNRNLRDVNVGILLNYFKLNEMDHLKDLLLDTISSNSREIEEAESSQGADESKIDNTKNDSSNRSSSPPPVDISALANKVVETLSLKSNVFYEVRRETAGCAVIINQKNFYEEPDEAYQHQLPKCKLGPRKGTDIDKQRLVEVFASFGYETLPHDDLNHIDMLHEIRETVARAFLKDSLIVCILSHGKDGYVYGSNSIPVAISDIEEIITTESLNGKPKMLIIQACQDKEDNEPESSESSPMESSSPKDRVMRKRLPPAPPCVSLYSDMIRAMSTVPRFVTWRHTKTGSWYIQSLCDALDKYGDSMHIYDILTIVTREVVEKRGENDEKMVPQLTGTLRKFFKLPTRSIGPKS